MWLFEWGERRFARGIARAMLKSHKLLEVDDPSLSELELTRKVLSVRPGEPAQQLYGELANEDFWENTAGSSFFEVVYLLVRLEYVEYMNGNLESEDEHTNFVFRKTILTEFNK